LLNNDQNIVLALASIQKLRVIIGSLTWNRFALFFFWHLEKLWQQGKPCSNTCRNTYPFWRVHTIFLLNYLLG